MKQRWCYAAALTDEVVLFLDVPYFLMCCVGHVLTYGKAVSQDLTQWLLMSSGSMDNAAGFDCKIQS